MMRPKKIQGFSLVELMVGLALGLMVILAVSSIFINTTNTRNEMERAGQQIENGRYAIQLLTDDLRMAGYYGEFNSSILTTPAAIPDPCATDVALVEGAVAVHVQSYDQGASAPACLTDVKSASDILVVRRASGCVASREGGGPETGCEAKDDTYLNFQTTLCDTEFTVNPLDHFVISATDTDFDLTNRSCTDLADIRRFITHIYYVANNNNSGDGVPTLKRAELKAGSINIEPLVEGIENLQFSYGLDSAGGDGSIEEFVAAPEAHSSCSGADCVENLRNILAVDVSLISRSTEATPGHSDIKTYTLAADASGDPQTFGPYNDEYKRHAYRTTVRLNNPAGRRE